jgi:hypothetical protein
MNAEKKIAIHFINLWLFPAVLLFGVETAAFGQAAEPIMNVEKVTITPAKAEQGDTSRMNFLRTQGARIAVQGAPVYIVKVYLSGMPPVDDDGFDVMVGDKSIGEYGSFSGGIFFKVYDPNTIPAKAGKELSIIRRGKTIKTGVVFPSEVSRESIDNTILQNKTSGETPYPSIADVLRQ